jgi:hypothetical protein
MPFSQKADTTQTKVESMDTKSDKNANDHYYEQGDLVYRSYDSSIKLEKGSELYIPEPDIKLQDKSKASIWADNLETNERQKIMDYSYPKRISFIADKSGTYVIYAMIEDKDSTSYLDLAKQGIIRDNADSDNVNGIMPLK